MARRKGPEAPARRSGAAADVYDDENDGQCDDDPGRAGEVGLNEWTSVLAEGERSETQGENGGSKCPHVLQVARIGIDQEYDNSQSMNPVFNSMRPTML